MLQVPRVSIGLPVFNGARFLSEAIESILNQTFTDFELIIADNASTDATQDICLAFAARDPRIKYIRHPRNIGAAKNYNYVAQCASGEFFKWGAHDDILGPDFLAICMEGMARHGEDTVLVYPNFQYADEQMRPLDIDSPFVHTVEDDPVDRMRETLAGLGLVTSIFGLYRREALMKTRLIGSFISSDFVTLVETALLGKIARLEGSVQFTRRLHDEISTRACKGSKDNLTAWFDPDAVGRGGRFQGIDYRYLGSVMTVPGLTRSQRLRASLVILRRIVAMVFKYRVHRLKSRFTRNYVSMVDAKQ